MFKIIKCKYILNANREANIQAYLQDVLKWTKDNDLLLNTDKTTCTLLTPDLAEYNKQLGLQIDNTTLPMTTHPKILGLTLDPKLTYNRHIDLAATKARKTINILKVLTSTKWGKHKETILATYKAITRPVLEYASTIWSPNASEINIDKLQIVQNTALRIATGCTHDTNTQHLHDETNVLPIHQHLQLHASQIRQIAQHPTHPLHKLTIHPHTPRLKKQTTFNNINYTTNIDTHPDTVTQQQISANSTQIHTSIVQIQLMQRNHNKLIHQHALKISPSGLSLPRETRRTLAQLRTNKSPILISYLHKVDETHHPSPLCPLCKHTPTYHRPPFLLHTPIYLKQYTGPLVVSRESGAPADQVEETPGRVSLEKLGCRTTPQLNAGGVGRQQQQQEWENHMLDDS